MEYAHGDSQQIGDLMIYFIYYILYYIIYQISIINIFLVPWLKATSVSSVSVRARGPVAALAVSQSRVWRGGSIDQPGLGSARHSWQHPASHSLTFVTSVRDVQIITTRGASWAHRANKVGDIIYHLSYMPYHIVIIFTSLALSLYWSYGG